MADYDTMPYSDMFHERSENVTDLQAYYMSQFNLELENGKQSKKDFKSAEESFDFEVLNWSPSDITETADFEIIDQVIDTNINDHNIKEVLLDLDSIDFEQKQLKVSESTCTDVETNFYETNHEYIDDESLIDELCREDGESCRLSPDFNEDYLVPDNNQLPSIETAFSKRYCNFNTVEENKPQNCYNYDNYVPTVPDSNQIVNSIEHYSYPNNILYNLDCPKTYALPDTPTSVTEFSYDRGDRKVSVSESIESDVHNSSYYDDNSENLDEDELFVNLDDFGINFEKDTDFSYEIRAVNQEKRVDKEKAHGERVCLWERCYERYPNQSTLVEHIERTHVNTYKGDEFSCLWRECSRARRPFNARYKLLIHMRVHSGHKPNRCHHPGCGKAFSRLENLKIHVRSHTGERPYACLAPHCKKAFSNSSDRAKHQRTHFNARPYACGAAGCGKRYTDPSSLRKHVKSHPHVPVPRTCVPPTRPMRRPEVERLAPSSPAKPTTLRSIRDKLAVTRMHRI